MNRAHHVETGFVLLSTDGSDWEKDSPRDGPDGYVNFDHHSEIAKEDICIHSVLLFDFSPIRFVDCHWP